MHYNLTFYHKWPVIHNLIWNKWVQTLGEPQWPTAQYIFYFAFSSQSISCRHLRDWRTNGKVVSARQPWSATAGSYNLGGCARRIRWRTPRPYPLRVFAQHAAHCDAFVAPPMLSLSLTIDPGATQGARSKAHRRNDYSNENALFCRLFSMEANYGTKLERRAVGIILGEAC